jgi:hypothetical protein
LQLFLLVCADSNYGRSEEDIGAQLRGTERSHWPHLVGKRGKSAQDIILSQRPELDVVVLPHDSTRTSDFRPDRVRIFVDGKGRVMYPPRVG